MMVAAAIASLVLAGCGGGGSDSSGPLKIGSLLA